MKNRRILCLLALGGLVLALLSCSGPKQEDDSAGYLLYFRQADLTESAGGDVFQTETISLPEDLSLQERVTALLEALLAGPENVLLRSALPSGTALLSAQVDDGRVTVDFSRPYRTLSGVRLTLADYAVTLTLTQLPEISLVRITVQGQELAYRDKQLFTARDVLLSSEEDVVGSVEAVLYFLDENGLLVEERRTLDVYVGDTQAMAVVRALENPPEAQASPLPEGLRIKTVWLEESTCYVNLPSALIPPETSLDQALDALRLSLCSLEPVEDVRFLVDGELSDLYNG